LDINEHIYAFNKLMSIGVDGKESQILLAANFLKTAYVFKKSGVLKTMVLSTSKGCIYLTWIIIFGNVARGHKGLRTNPFEEGDLDE